jgi:hypothetical protein
VWGFQGAVALGWGLSLCIQSLCVGIETCDRGSPTEVSRFGMLYYFSITFFQSRSASDGAGSIKSNSRLRKSENCATQANVALVQRCYQGPCKTNCWIKRPRRAQSRLGQLGSAPKCLELCKTNPASVGIDDVTNNMLTQILISTPCRYSFQTQLSQGGHQDRCSPPAQTPGSTHPNLSAKTAP